MKRSQFIQIHGTVVNKNEIMTIILGGGRGSRLMPLTESRSKPAVSFGGKYRLIDVPISNALNANFEQIFVLTQFNSYSLNRHISRTYTSSAINRKSFVEIIAAEQTNTSANWFEGTADAVRKVLPHIQDYNPKYIIILSGDQLYNMDLTEFVTNHITDPETEISVAANSIPESRIHGLGIVRTTEDGIIQEFIEKPNDVSQVEHCRRQDGNFLANMGIYVFNTDALEKVLNIPGKTDFGKEIIPEALENHKTRVYEYKGYWEDIGTIKAFYEANLMLTDELPAFNLYLEESPLYTRARSLPPSKLNNARVFHGLISEGSILNDCDIHRSVIGIRTFVDQGSRISESVILGADRFSSFDRVDGKIPIGIGPNCEIHKAIVDKDVAIGKDVKLLNHNNLQEYQDEYVYIRDGIILVPKRAVIPDGYEI